jgi:hypothetical protein
MNISDKTIAQLRSEGCMVIVWTPEEIGNANFRVSQDQIVEFGNQILDDQKEEDELRIGSVNLSPRSDWKMPGEGTINGQLTI